MVITLYIIKKDDDIDVYPNNNNYVLLFLMSCPL